MAVWLALECTEEVKLRCKSSSKPVAQPLRGLSLEEIAWLGCGV
jgi:hypothetical protein